MGGRVTKMAEVSESVKLFVSNTIKQKKVVVFSKSYCPYCIKAKDALKKYPIDPNQFEILEIENRSDCQEIQEYLRELTGASSV